VSTPKTSLGEQIASEFYNTNAILSEVINKRTAPLLARIAELEGTMRSIHATMFRANVSSRLRPSGAHTLSKREMIEIVMTKAGNALPDAEEETRRQKEAFRSDMQDDL
jgi:hypothetical protein